MKLIINHLVVFMLTLNAFAATTTTSKVTTASGDLILDTASSTGKVQANSKISATNGFEVLSTTKGAIPCPLMTDAQMLAISSPVNGYCVFNTDKKLQYVYDSVSVKWKANGGTGSGLNQLLTNYSFDDGASGWTIAAGTASKETTIKVEGDASLKIVLSSQTLSVLQDSTLFASNYNGTINGIAFLKFYSTVAANISLCSRNAGVTSTNCKTKDVVANQWTYFAIPSLVLGATSNGWELKSSAAVTGSVYLDDSGHGAAQVYEAINVLSPWLAYTPTLGAGWGTATSISGRYRQVGESYEVQVKFTAGTTTGGSGSISIPNGKLVGAQVASSSIVGYLQNNIAADNTRTVIAVAGNNYVEMARTYTASSLVTPIAPNNIGSNMEIQAQFSVPITGLAAQADIVYGTNQDTDWAPCVFATNAWQGLGTVDPSLLRCRRDGSDLLIRGAFTTGSPVTTSVAQILLPSWGGVQLKTASSTNIVPFNQFPVGSGFRATASTNNFFNAFVAANVNYINVSLPLIYSTNSAYSAATGSGIFNSTEVEGTNGIWRIPIDGWLGSNVITADVAGLPKVTGAYGVEQMYFTFGGTTADNVCSSGTCFMLQIGTGVQKIDWVSLAHYTITFNKTYSKLMCMAQAASGSGGDNAWVRGDKGATTSSISCTSCSTLPIRGIKYDHSGTTDITGTLFCVGTP